MVERRWHKKSRNGCDQCKQRRVKADAQAKCDETLPICRGCVRRQSQCSYADSPRSRHTASNSPKQQQQDTTTQAPGRNGYEAPNATELELMHHFTLRTYKTCDTSVLPEGWWQEQLPLMATQHDHLLYAMFSFTSLHMATLRPAEAQKYIALALDYRDRTLKILPTFFDTVARNQAEACFWSSAFIGLITLALYTTPAKQDQSPKAILLEVWALWKGTGLISNQFAAVMGEGFSEQFNPISPVMAVPTLQLDSSEFDAKLLHVRACVAQEQNLSPDLGAELTQAIDDLSKALILFKSSACHGTIMAWFPRLGRPVMEQFQAGNEVTTFVMIFYGVALHLLVDVWYIQNLGAKLVSELTSSFPLNNKEKVALVNWAREKVCPDTMQPFLDHEPGSERYSPLQKLELSEDSLPVV